MTPINLPMWFPLRGPLVPPFPTEKQQATCLVSFWFPHPPRTDFAGPSPGYDPTGRLDAGCHLRGHGLSAAHAIHKRPGQVGAKCLTYVLLDKGTVNIYIYICICGIYI